MFFAIAVTLVVASIVLHELGHAYWMLRYGVGIKVFGIGIPVPRLTLNFSFRGVPVRISPLLLGAYVRVDDEEAWKALPWRQQADISGAGPLMNLAFTGACTLVLNLHTGRWPVAGIALMAIGAAALMMPRLLSRYVMPVLSVPLLAGLIYAVARNPAESIAGPVGIAQMAHKLAESWPTAVLFAGAMSFSIGLMNMLPLMPLDGGRIMGAIIGEYNKKAVGIFESLTSTAVFVLILYALGNDACRLFSPPR